METECPQNILDSSYHWASIQRSRSLYWPRLLTLIRRKLGCCHTGEYVWNAEIPWAMSEPPLVQKQQSINNYSDLTKIRPLRTQILQKWKIGSSIWVLSGQRTSCTWGRSRGKENVAVYYGQEGRRRCDQRQTQELQQLHFMSLNCLSNSLTLLFSPLAILYEEHQWQLMF